MARVRGSARGAAARAGCRRGVTADRILLAAPDWRRVFTLCPSPVSHVSGHPRAGRRPQRGGLFRWLPTAGQTTGRGASVPGRWRAGGGPGARPGHARAFRFSVGLAMSARRRSAPPFSAPDQVLWGSESLDKVAEGNSAARMGAGRARGARLSVRSLRCAAPSPPPPQAAGGKAPLAAVAGSRADLNRARKPVQTSGEGLTNQVQQQGM